MPPRPSIKPLRPRSHHCGRVSLADVGKRVTIGGWLHPPRKAGSQLVFYPVSDHTGTIQVTAIGNPLKDFKDLYATSPDSAVLLTGIVKKRQEAHINPDMETGSIEIGLESVDKINPASTRRDIMPFFPSSDKTQLSTEMAMSHRLLALRHHNLALGHNIRARSRISSCIRSHLESAGFLDISTPILMPTTGSSTGAAEFKLASRALSLPQSPQIPKQMLMASGVTDRYYQIARCFRDEDGRKDRQLEFEQVDLEMAWSDEEGLAVRSTIEGLISVLWRDILDKEVTFEEIKYQDAMRRWGSDKPDVRSGYEIQDGSHLTYETPSDEPLSEEDLRKIAQEDIQFHMTQNAQENKVVYRWQSQLSTSHYTGSSTPLGRARLQLLAILRQRGLLQDTPSTRFLWITDFPLFELEGNAVHGTHHPFTAPHAEDWHGRESLGLSRIRGRHYDLVLDGTEIGGGSVRIHDRKLQETIIKDYIKCSQDEIEALQPLMRALEIGCPPHAGIALGLDRLVAALCGVSSIRDVIPFPKSVSGSDLTFDPKP